MTPDPRSAPPTQEVVRDHLAQVLKEKGGALTGALVRHFRDLELAQDTLQQACRRALETWPRAGLPDRADAWLLVTAKRSGTDVVRRAAVWSRKAETLGHERSSDPDPETVLVQRLDQEGLDDDLLRLIFLCCHPALNPEAQLALTLQTACGLDTEEIARCFLSKKKTIAQRVVRAKRKIRAAGVPFRIPPPHLLGERLQVVLTVIYLIYNEGFLATREAERTDLAREAIRLATLVARRLSGEAEAAGLLALLLLVDSRRATRFDDDGVLVELHRQDRSRWDRDQIGRALELLRRTLMLRRVGPFQVQASIQAIHAEADTAADTDWHQIVALYDVLRALQPSPVVMLNRAVAVRMAHGPQAATTVLDRLAAAGALDGYHLFHVAQADCRAALGDTDGAVQAWRRALKLTGNPAERAAIERRLREADDKAVPAQPSKTSS